MVTRFLESKVLQQLDWMPAVAILGPRQVGKTTLAKHIAQHRKKSLYLDVENPRDMQKLEGGFGYLDGLKDYTVILDELQLKPDLFSVLRPVIDADRHPGRFIVLGSASPHLVKGVSESLAGRIAYLELSGLNLQELPKSVSLKRHWFLGGFPNAILVSDIEAGVNWLQQFIRSYVERDLGLVYGTSLDSAVLRPFLQMLAHTTGTIWNAELFARSLGVSAPTVMRYIQYLEGAFLVRRLSSWSVNVKKRIIKAPKVYIRDTGFIHQLLDIATPEALLGHPVAGGSWESYVIEQIAQRKSEHLDLYYYRTQAGAECDLVLVKGMQPIACIEIKLGEVPHLSKGFFIAAQDLAVELTYAIVPQTDRYVNKHGVIVCGLSTFLEDELTTMTT